MALKIKSIEKGIKRTNMSIQDQLNMELEQLTPMENAAKKWLEETDTIQFSQMELLSMFAESQIKENNKLYSASFLMWITGIKELSVLKKKYGEYKNQIEKLKRELKN